MEALFLSCYRSLKSLSQESGASPIVALGWKPMGNFTT